LLAAHRWHALSAVAFRQQQFQPVAEALSPMAQVRGFVRELVLENSSKVLRSLAIMRRGPP